MCIQRRNNKQELTVNCFLFGGGLEARHSCPKIYGCKINKMPKFYKICARKCPNFTQHLPEKYFSRNFVERERAYLRAGKCADLPVSFHNSFRRILIHRYYGFLPFRRSPSPKLPKVSVGVRVRIIGLELGLGLGLETGAGFRRFKIRRNAKEPSYLVRMMC